MRVTLTIHICVSMLQRLFLVVVIVASFTDNELEFLYRSGKTRRIRVFRRFRGEENVNAADIIPRVEFSEGSAEVLGDLFMRYPPGDGEGAEERMGEGCQKIQKALRKKDPLFCRTSMGRDEVVKKAEAHAKMKNSKVVMS